MTWSDGEPITAADFAFTWQTVVDIELLGRWQDYTDYDVEASSAKRSRPSVEATSLTVRVTFNAQPGLADLGPRHRRHRDADQPMHFWAADASRRRKRAEDPRMALLAASGASRLRARARPSYADRQEGAFAASTVNENYYDPDAEHTSGGVTWTEGPFATNFQFPLYGGQEAAVLALGDGEVDYLLNPLGMQRGFQDQVAENPDLTAVVNPTNGYRFLAFNHARAPMSDAGLPRRADGTDRQGVRDRATCSRAWPSRCT